MPTRLSALTMIQLRNLCAGAKTVDQALWLLQVYAPNHYAHVCRKICEVTYTYGGKENVNIRVIKYIGYRDHTRPENRHWSRSGHVYIVQYGNGGIDDEWEDQLERPGREVDWNGQRRLREIRTTVVGVEQSTEARLVTDADQT